MTVLLFAALAYASAAADSSQIERKQTELEQMRARIETLQARLSAQRAQRGTLQGDLAAIERRLGEVHAALRAADRQQAELEQRLSQLTGEKSIQLATLERQRRALAHSLRAAYALGRRGDAKIILDHEQPGTLARTLTYHQYVRRQYRTDLDALNTSMAALADVELNMRDRKARLEALLAEQNQRKQTLLGIKDERRLLLAKLDAAIGDDDLRLRELRANESDLQDLIGELRKALVSPPPAAITGLPFAKLKGKLSLPTPGTLSARYGEPRPLGALKWQGVVIDADEGRDIEAVAAGRVVFADWLRGYGLLLIVDHGQGYMSLYGYNQHLHKRSGDLVRPREVIASVGSSGGNARPGLYFEIRHQGAPLDPLQWCKT